ncbi:DUF881 domain-containing protein [Acetivibrio clariflavus]|uniref:DUF881 domain-containing protein n=1 Tax=Acetivibrio clariflavus (strain DSM 19732 / NBRC 101661 / EBR45) TaxID=720554 RepID=G8M1A2_ACECE|nr:DUF881 domain-containing protein [Acetivibrio clariflavus]AEV68078.1 hypothetical protein Clocl_1427 [Acetivibrio clariflavus DSM 19732]
MKFINTVSLTLICMIMGITVAWQYKSVYNNKKTASVQSMTLEDLKDKLIIEKKNNEELKSRRDALDKEIREFEAAKGNIDLYKKNIGMEMEKARIIAGLTDVKGSGINITISVKNTNLAWISFKDLLSIVNVLKAAEANAIAINGERITAMTEISEIGNYIIINGVPMSSDKPFVIKAIFENQKIDYSVKMLGSIFDKMEKDGYINVEVEKLDSITIPKIEKNRSSINFDLLKR